jgi:hypothetical protein
MKSFQSLFLILICILSLNIAAESDTIPNAIHYQGQIKDGNIRYEGTAIFRFAIIDDTTPTPLILWSNDGTVTGKTADNVPTNGVSLNVIKGLFDLGLGDESLVNMNEIPLSVFQNNKTTSLRVWFQKDSGSDIDLLSPDTMLLAVPFAFHAGSVHGDNIEDGSITRGKLARESVCPENEGRSNTIRSFYFDITTRNTSKVLYDVPDGKTFVITDIYITSADKATIWTITDDTTGQLIQYYKFAIDARLPDSLQNWTHSFKAGLRFKAPEVISIFPQDAPENKRIRGTISGFEFDTPQ